jgi:hypothetical protein
MEPLKKHGDPLEDEIQEQPARNIDEVSDNQPGAPNARTVRVGVEPGSKGRRDEEEQPIVRSASQTPNPNQPDDDATMEPGGDLGNKRTNM